eukprot:TRINITY_DN728_c0_g1_i1.p1 TRINITY_DN728_c0_g1~~TRINITY_DN728_c0_g1_i1.p1  ORF type:complete len:252 (-),score=72.02 TRINITY_DN728_c0_g1_i1:107-862(-)
MEGDLPTRFANEVRNLPVIEQARFFLRAFVLQFQGRFNDVLDIADQFVKFSSTRKTPQEVCELTEHEGHLFLEARGETLTVVRMREHLRAIDIKPQVKVAFIEYLLWKYQKNLPQLFTPPPAGSVSKELLEMMDKAINDYMESKRVQQERVEEMKRLEEASGGKRTVQSVQAQNQRQELAGQEFSQKFKEMQALKKKKEVEEAIANAPKVDPYQEEQKRLAEEARLKAEAEAKSKEDSRNRLKARASLWGN